MISVSPKHNPRVETLDSLRGIAALFVVFGHFLASTVIAKILVRSPFNFIIGGHEAVVFFFMLSGYVLTYQYERKTNFSYGKFLVHRFFRLYIPYIVSILFCVLFFLSCEPVHLSPEWVNSVRSPGVIWDIFADHLLLIHNFNTSAFNPVVWSLVHEMRITLIFPLFLWLVRLKPGSAMLIVFCITIISAGVDILNLNPSAGYDNSYSSTAHYLYVFLAGGLIAKHQHELLLIYRKLKPLQKGLLLIFMISLYNYGTVGSFFLLFKIKHLSVYLNEVLGRQAGDFLVATACFYFIVAAVALSGSKTFLKNKILLFLGKISYSLYLVHLPVFAFVYYELNGRVQILLLLSLGFVASFFVAVIFNKYIEQFSMRLAKKITA